MCGDNDGATRDTSTIACSTVLCTILDCYRLSSCLCVPIVSNTFSNVALYAQQATIIETRQRLDDLVWWLRLLRPSFMSTKDASNATPNSLRNPLIE